MSDLTQIFDFDPDLRGHQRMLERDAADPLQSGRHVGGGRRLGWHKGAAIRTQMG